MLAFFFMVTAWIKAVAAQMMKALLWPMAAVTVCMSVPIASLLHDHQEIVLEEAVHIWRLPVEYLQIMLGVMVVSLFCHAVGYIAHRRSIYVEIGFVPYIIKETAGFMVRASTYFAWTMFCNFGAHLLDRAFGMWYAVILYVFAGVTVLVIEGTAAMVQLLGSEQRFHAVMKRAKKVGEVVLMAKEEGIKEAIDEMTGKPDADRN
jgi:hypothetical protein